MKPFEQLCETARNNPDIVRGYLWIAQHKLREVQTTRGPGDVMVDVPLSAPQVRQRIALLDEIHALRAKLAP